MLTLASPFPLAVHTPWPDLKHIHLAALDTSLLQGTAASPGYCISFGPSPHPLRHVWACTWPPARSSWQTGPVPVLRAGLSWERLQLRLCCSISHNPTSYSCSGEKAGAGFREHLLQAGCTKQAWARPLWSAGSEQGRLRPQHGQAPRAAGGGGYGGARARGSLVRAGQGWATRRKAPAVGRCVLLLGE